METFFKLASTVWIESNDVPLTYVATAPVTRDEKIAVVLEWNKVHRKKLITV